jgi:hypothetical protein
MESMQNGIQLSRTSKHHSVFGEHRREFTIRALDPLGNLARSSIQTRPLAERFLK